MTSLTDKLDAKLSTLREKELQVKADLKAEKPERRKPRGPYQKKELTPEEIAKKKAIARTQQRLYYAKRKLAMYKASNSAAPITPAPHTTSTEPSKPTEEKPETSDEPPAKKAKVEKVEEGDYLIPVPERPRVDVEQMADRIVSVQTTLAPLDKPVWEMVSRPADGVCQVCTPFAGRTLRTPAQYQWDQHIKGKFHKQNVLKMQAQCV